MIGSIKGMVVDSRNNKALVDVGGVGYLVNITSKAEIHVSKHLESKEPLFFWTHLAVRENALDLYGFLSPDELTWFEKLLTISGVGPKSALSILSVADPEILNKSIRNDDAEYLHKTSGLGLKTAQKVVVALKDKMEDFGENISSHKGAKESSIAFDALVSLGYSPQQVRQALKDVGNESTAEGQIRQALKKLN